MKRIFPLLLVLVSVSLYADKYDDLIIKMSKQTPNVAFYNYQQFQKAYPHVGNVYFQLGKISHEYLLQANPLHDLKAFRYYAYNAKLYYGNCLHFATENELRKTPHYYTGVQFSKKPTMQDLNEHIRPILKEVADITEAGNKLNAAFVHLLSQYERCVQLFLELNTKFTSLNDALLLATTDDLKAMHELQSISDSIPDYISSYQQALERYKIKGYEPTFEIVPVELFRIDALCSVNFLANRVVLYDFGAWVRQFETRRETRVMPILSDAHRSYKKQMEKNDFRASISLINSLYQLDPTSYLASVLQIRNVHNQVMDNEKKFADSPEDKRLAMLYDMSVELNVAHAQHDRLRDLDTADMQRYSEFTSSYFSEIKPYESLVQTVLESDSVYDMLLAEFRVQHRPEQQADEKAIVIPCGTNVQATLCYLPSAKRNQLAIEAGRSSNKTNININAVPKALFYLEDANQLVMAHEVEDELSAEWKTQLTLYDLTNKELIEWVSLPLVDSIAYVTTMENGHAIVVNEESTRGATCYFVNLFDQVTPQPIITQEAEIISLGHYNPDTFVSYLLVDEKPQLLLIDKP